ncbi:MAG: hypothetical protein JKX84_08895 [Flavobacteriales bacterium]|nr:hypothetical protein [Flavobacteriales bacterium]
MYRKEIIRAYILSAILGFLTTILWVRSEYWPFVFQIGAIDVISVFRSPPQDLRPYFPNWYRHIFFLGQLMQYGFPIIVGFILLKWRGFRRQILVPAASLWTKESSFVKFIALPASITFVLTLAFYLFLRPQSSHPYQFQLQLIQLFLSVNLFSLALGIFYNGAEWYKRLVGFLFKVQQPYSLAITRILYFIYSINLYLMLYLDGRSDHIGVLKKASLPMIGWLIEILPITPEIYTGICYLGGFFSFMIVIGYKTRFFLLLNAISVFYVVAAPNFFGGFVHDQLVIWIAWILAASPCADVLSIDSWKSKTNLISSKKNYGFHLKIMWLHFGIVYLFAGFYKLWLCGFDWALTNSMINQVQIEWFEHYDRVSELRLDLYPTLLKIGGLGVIVFEFIFILLLFDRRTKWVSIIGGLTMHKTLGKLMYISFFHTLQVFYLVFIPWNQILKKLKWIKPFPIAKNHMFSLKKPKYGIPVFILAMNFVFGVFNINSYPFSIYPVYAEIIGDNVRYFEYHILDEGKTHIDARLEAKKYGFKWEDFSRIEYYLIRDRHNGLGLDSAGVRKMWLRWKLGVPSLSSVNSVDVYIVERPIAPEKKHIRLSEEYLMSIY